MSKNIARLAVTAGLTAVLSFGGVMAPVTMAFAAGTPTVATDGNVKIDEKTYKDTTFKGIQIFKAKVTQNYDGSAWSGEKTLSDIDWASPDVMSVVTGAFTDVAEAPAANAGAQAWAKYIKDNAGNKVGQTAKVDAGSTLDKIAAALEGSTLTWTNPGDSSKGDFKALNTGYWLFVTANVGSTTSSDSANGNTDAYTSPIFTVVGGEDVKAEPKKDVPNVTKAVKDDAVDGTFGTFENPNKAADSQMGDYVDYLLTGTVASNINTYSTYKYTFTDELPKSMTPKFKDGSTTPDVTVKIGDTEVKTDCYTAKYVNDKITVDFTDLKNCTDESGNSIVLNSGSKVTVEYKAKLDSTKIFENGKIKDEFKGLVGKAQKNKVTLTYSNNPHAEGVGATVEHPAYDYTYGIDVTKVGSDDETKGLKGVEFTLQEQGDINKFIMANGVKTTDEAKAKLTTDDSGKLNVVGLDEGTYVLTEVTPAPGYNNSAANGVTFTIKRDLNQNGDDVTPSADSAINAANGVVKNNSATASTGKLSFIIVDQQGSGLPLTGLNGVTFTWIAGGAVLCIGVAHLIRSRKQAEESEQE
ncbi:SpaA isopeptide-forming pilin-related protein [Collinsella sp. LCP19S3_C6]|uniref:SpaA isopeptide-forming pilin-related protein n=1 Tax=unclassified Collinsella TaxID=2637548 RepID=UPI003F8CDADA